MRQASSRGERHRLAQQLRAEGKTWAEIAEVLRGRLSVSARAAMRLAHGWTQQQAADEWGLRWPDRPKDKKWFSYQERWPNGGRPPSLGDLNKLAQLYQCTVADLLTDLDYQDLDPAPDRRDPSRARSGDDSIVVSAHVGVTAEQPSGLVERERAPAAGLAPQGSVATGAVWTGNDEEVDRREFTTAAVLGALTLPAAVRDLLTAPGSDRLRISITDIEAIRAYMEDSRQHDAAFGGGSACDVAAAVHAKARDWLADRPGSRSLRHGLNVLVGDLGAWVAWLAYDAGRPALAQRYLHDTIVHARLVDYPAVEVRAMACMCLLLNRSGRPGEALQCAEAAQRIAEPWATPRLTALLHMRAAAAFARLDEPSAFAHELAEADIALDRKSDRDEIAWTGFVTPAELTGLAGQSQLVLGRPHEAAGAFRQIADDPDPAYHRNAVYYTVQLAHATAQQGDTAGAAEIALGALPQVSRLESGRTRRSLRQLRVQLDRHRAAPTVDDFADAYDQAMTA